EEARRAAPPQREGLARPVAIADVALAAGISRPTHLDELDRVLGGGLVRGSVTLLGGEPGVGKSTLLLPALTSLARSDARCRLVRLAKERDMATILVGHVTKDGALAGPRVLEHAVDTVLSFDGDRHHALRLLRAVKHRFGATGEIGLFEMAEDGLAGVADPAA